jgi:hypothetical protein
MADTSTIRFEPRMLIDGKLVDGEAGTFANINPATEERLGEVADASKADMHRAIAAARRAFDETDWSTSHAFRKRCLEQLQAALDEDKEALREELILEAGCPRMMTHGPQLDAPLSSALPYTAKLIDEYPWDADLGDAFVELTARSRRGRSGASPWASSGRSPRGTTRSRSRSTSSRRRWPPATRSCSSRRRTRPSMRRASGA